MSVKVDPQLEKAQILVKYAQTMNESLKKDVEEIVSGGFDDFPGLPKLSTGPFENEEDAINAVVEAGKAISKLKFAGTVFGNVSVKVDDKLYISATGTELGKLEDQVVVSDLKGNSLNGLNPSSELPAHLEIVNSSSSTCILHAHPFYTVVMSLIKGIGNEAFGVPIVGGEVGGGEKGLSQTVPPVLKSYNVAVVHGHGTFAVDAFDFNNPLKAIYKLEKLCRKRYVSKYL